MKKGASRSAATSPPRPTALVTGASSGIGRATARELVARGWRVYGGVRRQEDAEALRHEGVRPLILDVRDEADVEAARDALAADQGAHGLQALVNNAGVSCFGPLEHTSPAELRALLEVNVVGVHAVTRALLPLLRAGAGRVVSVGSTSGRLALPYLGAYAASKHALEAWSDSLRRELREAGVSVILVQPGRVDTRMVRDAPVDPSPFAGTPYEEGARDMARRVRELRSAPLDVDLVARRVADAVEDRWPAPWRWGRRLRGARTRVLVVPGSWWKAWASGWLPAWVIDRVLARR